MNSVSLRPPVESSRCLYKDLTILEGMGICCLPPPLSYFLLPSQPILTYSPSALSSLIYVCLLHSSLYSFTCSFFFLFLTFSHLPSCNLPLFFPSLLILSHVSLPPFLLYFSFLSTQVFFLSFILSSTPLYSSSIIQSSILPQVIFPPSFTLPSPYL